MSSNSKSDVEKLPDEPSVFDRNPCLDDVQIGTQFAEHRGIFTGQTRSNQVTPLEIKRIVRKMRGGSQSRLVEGTDGRYYVAKFVGNPQGSRTLVNEWITWTILKHFDILTPTLRILKLPESLRNPELSFSIGNKKIPISGDLHLGSSCPVNPLNNAIFDFLPQPLLCRVSNLGDFSKIVVSDVWLRQADSRQAVFVRQPGLIGGKPRYLAYFVDHGMVLGGSGWDYRASVARCRYFNGTVYSMVDSQRICEDTIAGILKLVPANLYSAISELPAEWFSDGDLDRLAATLDKLWLSRRTLTTRCILGFAEQ